jgi:Uma2 family endonuclease
MKTAALIPVEEYLRTVYRPDRDYVDGEVLERNLGERDHSTLQRELIVFFHAHKREWKVFVYPEQRVQVAPTRFRIPDICVYVGGPPKEQIFRTPPFICIEVLSPDDRMARVQDRIDDYLKFGVPYVFLINPKNRRTWAYTQAGGTEVKDGILRTGNPSLTVPLAEIFAGVDEEGV